MVTAPEEKEHGETGVLAKRSLVGMFSKTVFIIGLFASLFHIYVATTGILESYKMRSLHLALLLPLVFLIYPARKSSSSSRFSFVDINWFILSLSATLYFGVFEYDRILVRMIYVDEITSLDLIFGTILILAVLEGTRRVVGLAMVIITLFVMLYVFFGNHLPGFFAHPGFTFERIIENLVLTTNGILGIPIGASATFIFLFVLFGEFLQRSGAGKFFIDLAYSVTGSSKGGPAKMAVFSSALMGTVSGSAVGNVVSTGAYTIPLMKKVGYRPAFSGAVEAAASTGGQIMPPIMGAAAFILAEFVGIPYLDLALAALIPAILYFLGVGFMVHFEAVRLDLKGLPKEELPKLKEVLLKRGYLGIPIIVTIVVMVIGFSPYIAAVLALVSVLVVSSFSKNTRMGLSLILETLSRGAQAAVLITVTCACAGIIVGVASQTGFGVKFASLVINLSNGYLFLALPLVMIASIILGMGIPTSAAYIMVAAMAVPALVELGVEPLSAHLFAFYFAVVSAITPPVAIASFAAAGLSGADPIKTGIESVKLGVAAFIVPFMFAYHKELLLIGEMEYIILSISTAILGMIALAAAFVGYFITKLNSIERIVLFIVSILLINASGIVVTIGAILVLGFIVFRQARTKSLMEMNPNLKS